MSLIGKGAFFPQRRDFSPALPLAAKSNPSGLHQPQSNDPPSSPQWETFKSLYIPEEERLETAVQLLVGNNDHADSLSQLNLTSVAQFTEAINAFDKICALVISKTSYAEEKEGLELYQYHFLEKLKISSLITENTVDEWLELLPNDVRGVIKSLKALWKQERAKLEQTEEGGSREEIAIKLRKVIQASNQIEAMLSQVAIGLDIQLAMIRERQKRIHFISSLADDSNLFSQWAAIKQSLSRIENGLKKAKSILPTIVDEIKEQNKKWTDKLSLLAPSPELPLVLSDEELSALIDEAPVERIERKENKVMMVARGAIKGFFNVLTEPWNLSNRSKTRLSNVFTALELGSSVVGHLDRFFQPPLVPPQASSTTEEAPQESSTTEEAPQSLKTPEVPPQTSAASRTDGIVVSFFRALKGFFSFTSEATPSLYPIIVSSPPLPLAFGEIKRLAWELKSLEELPKNLPWSIDLVEERDILAERMRAIASELNELRSAVNPDSSQVFRIIKDIKVLERDLESFRTKGMQFAADEHQLAELDRFLQQPTPPIDNELLLHVIGDAYGKDTDLEGGQAVKNLDYLTAMLKERMEALSKDPVCSNEDRQGFCKAIFGNSDIEKINALSTDPKTFASLQFLVLQAIEIRTALEGPFASYYTTMMRSLDGLQKRGDSFFFPFRWPKHAVACEVIKDIKDSYTVRIYNTGEGSERQKGVFVESEEAFFNKQHPYIELVGVSKDSLSSMVFHKGLWELAQSQDQKFGAKTFYEGILPLLGGTPSKGATSNVALAEFLAPQISGTCSYRVLEAVFSQNFGNTGRPQKFNWEVALKTVVGFYQQHKKELLTDEVTRNNLRKALTELIALTNSMHAKGVITLAEKHLATSRILGISHALHATTKADKKLYLASRVAAPLTASEAVLPEFSGSVSYSSVEMKGSVVSPYHPVPILRRLEEAVSIVFSPECIVEQLTKFYQAYPDGHIDARTSSDIYFVYTLTKAFIQRLPAPSNDFWDSVPSSDVEETIKMLGTLSDLFLRSINQMVGSNPLWTSAESSHDFISQVKLLTLLDKLSQKLSPEGMSYPNLYQASFERIFNHTQLGFTVNDPLWEKELIDLKTYWKDRRPQAAENPDEFVSFFGFETLESTDSYSMVLYTTEEKRNEFHGQRTPSKTPLNQPRLLFAKWEFQQWALEYLRRWGLNPSHKGSRLTTELETRGAEKVATSVLSVYPFLPPIFYTLRSVSYVTYFLFNQVLQGSPEKELRIHWEKSRSLGVGESFQLINNQRGSNFIKGKKDIDSLTPEARWTNDKNSKNVRVYSGQLFGEYPPPDEAIADIFSFNGQRRRYSFREIFENRIAEQQTPPSPQTISLKPITIATFGEERIKEYLLLSAEPSQQVTATLSYFSQHRDQLSTPAGQWLCERLLFEPTLLLEALLKSPAKAGILIDQFDRFLLAEYQALEQFEDPRRVLFIVHLHRMFVDYVSYAQSEMEKRGISLAASQLPPVQEKILQFLDSPSCLLIKNHLNRELVLSYKHAKKLTKEEVLDLFRADIATQLERQVEGDHSDSSKADIAAFLRDNPLLKMQQQEVVAAQLDNIRAVMGDSDKRDFVLNSILRNYIPDFPTSTKWYPYEQFPWFSTTEPHDSHKGGNYVIDLLERKIVTPGGVLGMLPADIASLDSVKALKPTHPQTVITPNGVNGWRLVSPDKKVYYITKSKYDSKYFIHQEIKGKPFLLDKDAPLKMGSLTLGKTIWVFNEEKQSVFYLEDFITSRPYALVIPENKGMDISSGTLVKTLEHRSPLVVRRLDPQTGEETPFILEDVGNSLSELHFLTDIEKSEHILFWRNQETSKPEKVEIPRLGLTFYAEESGGEFHLTYQGYRVVRNQGIAALQGMSHYLVLEKQGVLYVLFPNFDYEKKSRSSLDTGALLSYPRLGGDRFYIYRITPDHRELVIPSEEARFFLAGIHLWSHHYKRALSLLKGMRGQRHEYTAAEIKRLEEIGSSINLVNKDASPEALTVRLYANILLIHNAVIFSDTKDDKTSRRNFDFKEIEKDYNTYLTSLARWGVFTLPKADEEFLLNILIESISNELESHRLKPKKEEPKKEELVKAQLKQLQHRLAFLQTGKMLLESSLVSNTVNVKVENLYLFDSLSEGEIKFGTLQSDSILKIENNPEGMMSLFNDLYHAVRYQNKEDLKKLLNELTGADYGNFPERLLIDELKRVLFLVKDSGFMYFIAGLLAFISEYPDKFPSSDTVPKIDASSGKQEFVEWYNPLLKAMEDEVYRLHFLSADHSKEPIRTVVPWIESTSSRTSAVPSTSLELSIPTVPSVMEFQVQEPNRFAVAMPSRNLSGERRALLDIFNFQTKDSVATRTLEEIRDSIATYQGPPEAERYQLGDWQAIDQLRQELKATENKESALVIALKNEIEELLNKQSSDRGKRTHDRLAQAGIAKVPLTIDDGLFLYLRHKDNALKHLNPALTPEDLTKILQKVQDYLILVSNQRHRLSILGAINQMADARARLAEGESIPQVLVDNFGTALHSKRQYNLVEYSEYLVLENFIQSFLRGKQVGAIDNLKIRQGREGIIESLGDLLGLATGAGKTSIIGPLMNLLHADGKHVAIGVALSDLLPQMADELSRTSWGAFRQPLNVVQINRNKLLDPFALKLLLADLKRAVAEGQSLLMSDSSVQGLFLRFSETVFNAMVLPRGSEERAVKLEEIGLYREIFPLLRESGIVTVDEIDSIMNVLKSNHYTFGQPEALPVSEVEGSIAFYNAFIAIAQRENKFAGNFFGKVTKEDFDGENGLRVKIIREMVHGNGLPESVRAAVQALTSTEKGYVELYLHNSLDLAVQEFIGQLPSEVRDVLAVIREQLADLAALTLSKGIIADFAYSEKDHAVIPANRGNPAEGSDFGTSLERINYTLQYYLLKGIPEAIVTKKLKALLEDLRKEMALHPELPIESFPSGVLLRRFVGKDYVIQLRRDPSSREISSITAYINQHHELITNLVSEYVFPNILVYPRQLNSNAYIYALMFIRVFGMSATLWNRESMPKIFHELYPSDSIPKTLFLLMQHHAPDEEIAIIDIGATADNIDVAVSMLLQNPEVSSIIDASGALLKWENKAVAEAMCRKLGKGIAYCDSNDRWFVLESPNKEPVPMAQTTLSRDQISVYWDLSHTRGSDVKTGTTEVAMLIFGVDTMLTDFAQAIGRLRESDKKQRVVFSIDKADEKVIRIKLKQALGQDVIGPLEFRHLLIYASYIQAMKIGDHNNRSLRNELAAKMMEKLFFVILDPVMTNEEVVALMSKVPSLFESKTENHPYEAYGKPSETRSREEVVAQLRTDVLNGPVMQVFRTDPVLNRLIDSIALEKELLEIIDRQAPLLSDALEMSPRYGFQKQVEVQKEKAKEKEKEKEKERETQRERERSLEEGGLLQRTDSYQWPKEGLFTRAYFSSVQPVLSFNSFVSAWREGDQFTPQFSDRLFSTRDLTPLHLHPNPDAAPFARSQEFLHRVIVVQDSKTGKGEVILCSGEDIKQLSAFLDSDLENKVPGVREQKVVLYDLGLNGIIHLGSDPIDSTLFTTDKELLLALVQAKFIAGISSYTEQELPLLKEWIEQNGIKKMKEYFTNVVLKRRQDSQDHYIHSDLYRLFH